MLVYEGGRRRLESLWRVFGSDTHSFMRMLLSKVMKECGGHTVKADHISYGAPKWPRLGEDLLRTLLEDVRTPHLKTGASVSE